MKIFFVPGASCSSWIWHHSIDYLNIDTIKLDWAASGTFPYTHIDGVSNWLASELKGKSSPNDTIIAHSMGGLAALRLMSTQRISFKQAIIVESFLSPPPTFFQNLHSDSISPDLKRKIKQMLDEERIKFDERLLKYLRDFQYDFELNGIDKNLDIHFIYGDRGETNKDIIYKNLDWPKGFKDALSTFFIPNSCHLPMLENPDEFYGLIDRLLE